MFTKSGYGPALGIAIVAAGASIAALTGCASGTGSTAASAGTSPASAGSGSSSGSAAGVTADSYSYRTPECTIGQLRISYTDNRQIRHGALAGMSKTDNVVTFTNVGRSTCVIEGFPGVAALNSRGAQVEQAVRSTSVAPGDSKVRPVYLKPGGVASALVSADTASCNKPTYVPGLLVTAPDTYRSVRLSPPGYMCLPSLTVSPVVPGNAAGFVF
jgi:Protein of unknown function (DUF4232)